MHLHALSNVYPYKDYNPSENQDPDKSPRFVDRLPPCVLNHDPSENQSTEKNSYNDLRFVDRLPPCVIHCFTGNREQAIKYLQVSYQ